jgi:hypothetical protein
MNLTNLAILLVHIAIIATAALTALFSNNIYVIGVFSCIMIALLIHTIILDRCTICDPEENLPVLNTTPTKLINMVLGISNEIHMKELEKIIVGLFALAFIGKFAILLLFESYKGVSYSDYLRGFSHKGDIHEYIYRYLN